MSKTVISAVFMWAAVAALVLTLFRVGLGTLDLVLLAAVLVVASWAVDKS